MDKSYREVDMCCGSVADKGKLLREFESMQEIIEQQREQIEKLHKENVLLRRRLNKGG